MIFIDILFSIIITVSIYTVPIVFYRYVIRRRKLDNKKAKIFCVVYAIFAFILMSVVKIFILEQTKGAGGSIILWSYVNYKILISGTDRKKANGNFELIAQNVACIYYIIKNSSIGKNYTEEQVLAATSIIDLSSYLKNGILSSNDIKTALTNSKVGVVSLDDYITTHGLTDVYSESRLVNLIIQLETFIFGLNRNLKSDEVVQMVLEEKDSIKRIVEQTLKEGQKCRLYKRLEPLVIYSLSSKQFRDDVSKICADIIICNNTDNFEFSNHENETDNYEIINRKRKNKQVVFIIVAILLVAAGIIGLFVNLNSKSLQKQNLNTSTDEMFDTETTFSTVQTTQHTSTVTTTKQINTTTEITTEQTSTTKENTTTAPIFETLVFTGTGKETIKGINVPYDSYYITCEYFGEHNFIVHLYDDISNSSYVSISNCIGSGNTVYGFTGEINRGYINIEDAKGSWKITIEKCVKNYEGNTLRFSGSGRSSIKNIDLPKGNYYITSKYYGEHNFTVYFSDNTNNRYKSPKLIANEIGECSTTYGYSGMISSGYFNIDSIGDWEIIIEPC